MMYRLCWLSYCSDSPIGGINGPSQSFVVFLDLLKKYLSIYYISDFIYKNILCEFQYLNLAKVGWKYFGDKLNTE